MKPNFPAGLLLLASGALAASALGYAALKLRTEADALHETAERLATERNSLQARHDALVHRRQDLTQRVQALRTTPTAAPSTPNSPASAPQPREPSGPHGNVYFPELLGDADYAQWFKAYSEPHVEQRHAVLFHELELPPASHARFKDLLIQSQLAQEAINGALELRAMKQPADTNLNDQLPLRRQLATDIESDIRAAIGDDAFAKYRAFANTLGARQELEPVFLRLSYAHPPITLEQEEALVNLFNESMASARRGAATRGQPPNRLSDEFIAQAYTILSPVQIEGLKQVQAEQIAARNGSMSFRNSSAVPLRSPGN